VWALGVEAEGVLRSSLPTRTQLGHTKQSRNYVLHAVYVVVVVVSHPLFCSDFSRIKDSSIQKGGINERKESERTRRSCC